MADVDTAEIVQNIEITRVVHARLGENRDNLVLGAANETGFLQPPFVVGRFFFFFFFFFFFSKTIELCYYLNN